MSVRSLSAHVPVVPISMRLGTWPRSSKPSELHGARRAERVPLLVWYPLRPYGGANPTATPFIERDPGPEMRPRKGRVQEASVPLVGMVESLITFHALPQGCIRGGGGGFRMPAVVRTPACHSRRFKGERPIGAATG